MLKRPACVLRCVMAPKKRPFAELGSVAELAGSYRADFNIREEEKIRHILGPRRGNKQRAPRDLNMIRTAAAEHATRARDPSGWARGNAGDGQDFERGHCNRGWRD